MIILQHENGEGAGTLLPFVPGARIVRVFAGERVPEEAEALVVLGGGMSAYDPLPHLQDEMRLLRRCLSEGRPVLGICLGSQLLAAALGAQVEKAPAKEIGFYRVRLSQEPDALFGAAPRDFVSFHWHGDRFSLPPGAVALASSTMTPLQAFRFGKSAWGVQFHLETDAGLLGAMVQGGAGELEEAGVDAGLLLAQAERELPRLREVAAGVFSRWTSLL